MSYVYVLSLSRVLACKLATNMQWKRWKSWKTIMPNRYFHHRCYHVTHTVCMWIHAIIIGRQIILMWKCRMSSALHFHLKSIRWKLKSSTAVCTPNLKGRWARALACDALSSCSECFFIIIIIICGKCVNGIKIKQCRVITRPFLSTCQCVFSGIGDA